MLHVHVRTPGGEPRPQPRSTHRCRGKCTGWAHVRRTYGRISGVRANVHVRTPHGLGAHVRCAVHVRIFPRISSISLSLSLSLCSPPAVWLYTYGTITGVRANVHVRTPGGEPRPQPRSTQRCKGKCTGWAHVRVRVKLRTPYVRTYENRPHVRLRNITVNVDEEGQAGDPAPSLLPMCSEVPLGHGGRVAASLFRQNCQSLRGP